MVRNLCQSIPELAIREVNQLRRLAFVLQQHRERRPLRLGLPSRNISDYPKQRLPTPLLFSMHSGRAMAWQSSAHHVRLHDLAPFFAKRNRPLEPRVAELRIVIWIAHEQIPGASLAK